MAEQLRPSLTVPDEEPLIAVPVEENGREMVRYFVSEEEADAALSPQTVRDVRALRGAWSDLDWDEAKSELDRIRHESKPTPPIEHV
jgi:hypothetical protein